jgi:single-strand DNA-binding protein
MLNKFEIIGALGRDAEVRKVNDFHVVQFSVATSETWKDANGNKQERTTWVECNRWIKSANGAEQLSKYLTKGSKVYCYGLTSVRAYVNENTKEAVGVLSLRVDDIKLIHTTRERSENTGTPPPTVDNYSDDDDLPF